MKVYVNDAEYQTYIKDYFSNQLTLVNHKSGADIIISGSMKKTDFHSNLKTVIVPYTGLDNIDLGALIKYEVKLFNVTVHAKFVAEKAVQLLLALCGNVVTQHNDLEAGKWRRPHKTQRIPWVSVFNQKVGIYGYGRIGQWIHQLLKPFGVDVFVIDRGKSYPEVNCVEDLASLIHHSDIIIVAAPLNKDTKHAFDYNHMMLMKDRYLVNVGRGTIIEEEAVYLALKNNILKGFASDVWYQYPKKDGEAFPSQFPIYTFDNVVLSPHCGGNTTTSSQLMMEQVGDHLKAILKGNFDDAIDVKKTG